MAKVIGFNKKAVHKTTCRKCSAIIEYTLNEVTEHKSYDYTGSYDIIKSICCPNCGNSTTVKGY